MALKIDKTAFVQNVKQLFIENNVQLSKEPFGSSIHLVVFLALLSCFSPGFTKTINLKNTNYITVKHLTKTNDIHILKRLCNNIKCKFCGQTLP